MKRLLIVLVLLWPVGGRADYEEGVEAEKWGDYQTAFRHFQTATDAGDPRGSNGLGILYFHGWGVPQDYVQAHKWINLAGASGDEVVSPRAMKVRDEVAAKMTPARLAEAAKLARDWKPK